MKKLIAFAMLLFIGAVYLQISVISSDVRAGENENKVRVKIELTKDMTLKELAEFMISTESLLNRCENFRIKIKKGDELKKIANDQDITLENWIFQEYPDIDIESF